MGELEMPDIPWFDVEETIERLRDTGMLEWIYHIRPTHPYWDGPEDIPFTNNMRNKFVKGTQASSTSSVISSL